MKAGTQNHLKTKRLKRLLGIPLYRAVGILETIWLLCSDCCDEGNIGKFSDAEIADYLEWDSDPSVLVRALHDSGWTDTDSSGRPIIHDWLDHCPEYIRERVRKRRARLSKSNKSQSSDDGDTTYVVQASDNGGQRRTNAGPAGACPVYSQPNQSQPNPTNPNQPTSPPTPQSVAAAHRESTGPAEAGRQAGRSAGFVMTWQAVGERLLWLGVDRAVEAIEASKANGCTPGHAHAAIDFGERHAFGPGAIFERLKIGLPTMGVNRGWPNTEAPAVVAQQLDAKANERAARLEKDRRDSAATALIKSCRKRGVTDESAIKLELAAAGLEWPK